MSKHRDNESLEKQDAHGERHGRARVHRREDGHRRHRGDREGGERRGGHGPHHESGHRRSRLFDYGELRILLLAMIKENPAHGYELMRQIEDRFAGNYVPSPGVIYPTLSWTEDMGYTNIATAENGKKQYSLTPEGEIFLKANRHLADELLTRKFTEGEKSKTHRGNAQLREAFERLRHMVKSTIGQQQDEQALEKMLNIINETITRIETEFQTKGDVNDK